MRHFRQRKISLNYSSSSRRGGGFTTIGQVCMVPGKSLHFLLMTVAAGGAASVGGGGLGERFGEWGWVRLGLQALGQWGGGGGQVGSGGRVGNHRGDPEVCCLWRSDAVELQREGGPVWGAPRRRKPGPWRGPRLESLPRRVGAAEGRTRSESFSCSLSPSLPGSVWTSGQLHGTLSVKKVSVDRDEDRDVQLPSGPAQGPLLLSPPFEEWG